MKYRQKHSILGLIPLFEVMSQLGVDPEPLLNRHGIDLDSLSGAALVDHSAEQDIIRDALACTDDPLFGLRVGSQSTFASYGTFALLMMTASTYREAVEASVQFQALSLLLMKYSLHYEKDFFEVRYALPEAKPEILPFIVDRDFAGTVVFFNELINEPRAYQMTAGVARPAPGRALRNAYQRLSGMEVVFDQPYSWFRLPNQLLSERLKHGNPLAHKLYRMQAQELLHRIYPQDEDIVSRVSQILSSYERRYPTAKEVATVLTMSERSLRRKLDSVGSSYRQLLDERRRERALALLVAEEYAVSELAEALGYAESASFLRAFRRWTGTTPRRYLRQ